MQILSGKLTAKQEFYQREPVRQGFDKNLSPHTAYGRVLCTNKRLYIRSYENHVLDNLT